MVGRRFGIPDFQRRIDMRWRLTLRGAAAMAAAAMFAVTIGDRAAGQTLIDPSSRSVPSRPPLAAKPHTSAHVKSCSAYGAGFVNIPGTDACIKIGGSVTVESTVSRGR